MCGKAFRALLVPLAIRLAPPALCSSAWWQTPAALGQDFRQSRSATSHRPQRRSHDNGTKQPRGIQARISRSRSIAYPEVPHFASSGQLPFERGTLNHRRATSNDCRPCFGESRQLDPQLLNLNLTNTWRIGGVSVRFRARPFAINKTVKP